jgi:hypothetical protein
MPPVFSSPHDSRALLPAGKIKRHAISITSAVTAVKIIPEWPKKLQHEKLLCVFIFPFSLNVISCGKRYYGWKLA